jgi:hypothetical protein
MTPAASLNSPATISRMVEGAIKLQNRMLDVIPDVILAWAR